MSGKATTVDLDRDTRIDVRCQVSFFFLNSIFANCIYGFTISARWCLYSSWLWLYASINSLKRECRNRICLCFSHVSSKLIGAVHWSSRHVREWNHLIHVFFLYRFTSSLSVPILIPKGSWTLSSFFLQSTSYSSMVRNPKWLPSKQRLKESWESHLISLATTRPWVSLRLTTWKLMLQIYFYGLVPTQTLSFQRDTAEKMKILAWKEQNQACVCT